MVEVVEVVKEVVEVVKEVVEGAVQAATVAEALRALWGAPILIVVLAVDLDHAVDQGARRRARARVVVGRLDLQASRGGKQRTLSDGVRGAAVGARAGSGCYGEGVWAPGARCPSGGWKRAGVP